MGYRCRQNQSKVIFIAVDHQFIFRTIEQLAEKQMPLILLPFQMHWKRLVNWKISADCRI